MNVTTLREILDDDRNQTPINFERLTIVAAADPDRPSNAAILGKVSRLEMTERIAAITESLELDESKSEPLLDAIENGEWAADREAT
jgi:hypothetical protein